MIDQSSSNLLISLRYQSLLKKEIYLKSLNAKRAISILVISGTGRKQFLTLCYEMKVVWRCKNAAISNAVFSGRERVLTERIGSIEFG